jgi:hypothetical protein
MKVHLFSNCLLLLCAQVAMADQLTNDQLLGANTYAAGTSPDALIALGDYSWAEEGGIAIGDNSYADFGGVALGYMRNAEVGAVVIGGLYMRDSEGAIWNNYYAGGNETRAIGSVAIGGFANKAVGDFSYALGINAWAGTRAFSFGTATVASAPFSIALGSQNISSSTLDRNSHEEWSQTPTWDETTVLFELGNGVPEPDANQWSSNCSNAITTLKNGQTTLTNKAWLNRDSSISPTADPSSATTDSGGEALVVEGHTRLKGKVIIEEAQGDISMGIYQ